MMAKNAVFERRQTETAAYNGRTVTELVIEPLSEALPRWRHILATMPGVTLYHREPWLRALERSYRLRLSVAFLSAGCEVLAGCVFARSARPLRSRIVSLPFSDFCPPLSADNEARDMLLDALVAMRPASRLEIRGVQGTARWSPAQCFERWTVDLTGPAPSVMRQMSGNFRRNAKRAIAYGVQVEKGSSPAHIRRFYALQLETRKRLGLPPQPLRFFMTVREEFSKHENVEVWFATHEGRDLAALFVLRDGLDLHCKWSARRTECVPGAAHLLNTALISEYAGRVSALDLGRADTRNAGLARFKREMGARAIALPYAYFPDAPRVQSSEVLGPLARTASRLWRRLPDSLTRTVGALLYRYLG